jgi:hypothetical protein
MSNRKVRWLLVAAGLVAVVLLGAGVIAFQPRTANHFGYALPGTEGLPFRISYQGRYYVNLLTCAGASWCQGGTGARSLCVTKDELINDNRWPLTQVGSIPTLFGAGHPILVDPAYSGLTQVEVFVVNGSNCYVAYQLAGRP